jgi:hypothetical protein
MSWDNPVSPIDAKNSIGFLVQFFLGYPGLLGDSEKDILISPSLNTQSCIKGLLVVQDFCFWAIWAARPVHKKQGLGRLWATFEGGFFMFSGAILILIFLNCSVRAKKLHKIIFFFFLILKKNFENKSVFF